MKHSNYPPSAIPPSAISRRRLRGVRSHAPDLPGWDCTSPLTPGAVQKFLQTCHADTTALRAHLYSTYNLKASKIRVYIAEGS